MIATTPEPIGPTMLLVDWFDRHYSRLKLSGKAAETKRQYRMDVVRFDEFLERPAVLADLNDDNVSAIMGWLVEKGLSPATANKFRSQIIAMWGYAARKRHVADFPDVDRLKEYTRAPKAWSVQEFSTLLSVARGLSFGQRDRFRTIGIPRNLWWESLLLMLYDTGLRIGAARCLRIEDFDPVRQTIFARAETQKQKADQTISVSDQTAAVLKRLAAAGRSDRELLFPFPYEWSTIYNHFRELLASAGLANDRRSKFHRIRRTSATLAELYAGEGSATRHLGHSSPKVTERYIDQSMIPANNVAAALPRPDMAAGTSATSQLSLRQLLVEYLAWRDVRYTSQASPAENQDTVCQVAWVLDYFEVVTVGDLSKLLSIEPLEGRRKEQLSGRTKRNYRTATIWFLKWLIRYRVIVGRTVECLARLEDDREVVELTDSDLLPE